MPHGVRDEHPQVVAVWGWMVAGRVLCSEWPDVSDEDFDMTRRAPKSVPAEVAERIAEWVPLSVRDEDPAVLDAVLPVVRRLATATGPQKIGAAQSLLWALAPFGVWAYHEHGSFSVRSVSHRNTQLWVTKVNKKQEVGWRSGARAALQRVGRATNESGWPLQPTPVPRQPAVAPYSDEEQDAFLEVAGLPGALNPAGRAWVVAAVFGAGLTGPEIGGTSVADIRNAGNGRLAVQVHGDRRTGRSHPRMLHRRGARGYATCR